MAGNAPPQTLAGAPYVAQIMASESDRRARLAFQALALKLAPPGGALFDFGAGPGIDSRFFAERGFTVDAYDVDPRMCDFFAEYCRQAIDSGRVSLERGDYPEFLARKASGAGRRIDLVVSNFAPLNLVDEPRELFAKFHAMTAPHGKLLLSVLNPWFIGDMRFRWWWRNVPRLWRDGRFFMPGPVAPHTRRRLADFAVLSAPFFTLARVFRGLPASGTNAHGIDVSRGGKHNWIRLADARFVFLVFERRQ
jgi:SAM-dependent methyltransferase